MWKETRVQFSIGFNLVWKTRVQFYIRPKWKLKKTRVQFYIVIDIGSYDCYRSLWNNLEKRYWKYQIKSYYVHFRSLYIGTVTPQNMKEFSNAAGWLSGFL